MPGGLDISIIWSSYIIRSLLLDVRWMRMSSRYSLSPSSLHLGMAIYIASLIGYKRESKKGSNMTNNLSIEDVASILTVEWNRCWKQEGNNETACMGNVMASTSGGMSQSKCLPCAICGLSNHITTNCQHKGKLKCRICDRFSHKKADC